LVGDFPPVTRRVGDFPPVTRTKKPRLNGTNHLGGEFNGPDVGGETYVAVPQLAPISTSQTLGTSRGTAASIIFAMLSASSLSFTDTASSS